MFPNRLLHQWSPQSHIVTTLFSKDKCRNCSWLMMHFALIWEHTNWVITFFPLSVLSTQEVVTSPTAAQNLAWISQPLRRAITLLCLLLGSLAESSLLYHRGDWRWKREGCIIPLSQGYQVFQGTGDSGDSTVDVSSKQKPRVLPKQPPWK